MAQTRLKNGWLEDFLVSFWSNFGLFSGALAVTLPETNITPKNGWLEYVGILLSYWGGLFSGAMLVSGRVVSGRVVHPNFPQLKGVRV